MIELMTEGKRERERELAKYFLSLRPHCLSVNPFIPKKNSFLLLLKFALPCHAMPSHFLLFFFSLGYFHKHTHTRHIYYITTKSDLAELDIYDMDNQQ